MSLIVSNVNITTASSIVPAALSPNLNTRPILYPLKASSVTYGIDQLFKTWEEEKYLPSTTGLGRAFDWLMGWTKDENDNPQPSILGRVMNLFSKKMGNVIKEAKDETSGFIPEGKVTSYTYTHDDAHGHKTFAANVYGTFEVKFFQEGCSSPSFKNANWDMRLEVDVPEDLHGYEDFFYNNLGTCLSESMLNEYFKSVSEYCQTTIVCGCPNSEKIFSYIYSLKKSSLKIYNFDAHTTVELFPNQNYPAPNQDLINHCYDESIYETYQWKFENNATVVFTFGMFLGACTVGMGILCLTYEKNKSQKKLIDIELEELETVNKNAT